MIATYYSKTLDKKVTIPSNLVDPQDACPNCNERHQDYLEWQTDDTVICQVCGCNYDPLKRFSVTEY